MVLCLLLSYPSVSLPPIASWEYLQKGCEESSCPRYIRASKAGSDMEDASNRRLRNTP